MFPIRRTLIVAAHPDDEILGVGGTIGKLTARGAEVAIVILCNGRPSLEERMSAVTKVAGHVLGVREVRTLNHPNLRLETYPVAEIAGQLEKIFADFKPETVLTHHYGDVNRDHFAAYHAVLTAARPLSSCCVESVFTFETPSSTDWAESVSDRIFRPNAYVDITETFDLKMEALRLYDDEMRPFPHSRSYQGVEALARTRGMAVGVRFAEAFSLIRGVWS